MHTKISYTYRDASNYKTSDHIYLEGVLTREDVQAIRKKCEDGTGFIPGQLGLNIEELQPRMKNFPSDDDHVFHDIDWGCMESIDSLPDGVVPIPAGAFIEAFAAIEDRNSWDVKGACKRLGLAA